MRRPAFALRRLEDGSILSQSASPGSGRDPAPRKKLPLLLGLLCAYLAVMLPVTAVMESAYALLSDDWSFGFRNSHVSTALGLALFCILAAHHVYRIFTITALLRKAGSSVTHAKVYVIASCALLIVFALSIVVSFSPSTRRLEFHPDGLLLPGAGLSAAILIMLAWWVLLSTSRKVKAFQNTPTA